MHDHAPQDHRRSSEPPTVAELEARRRRCARAATACLAAATLGAAWLSLSDLRPTWLAIPVFLATAGSLLIAGGAALFACVAGLELDDRRRGWDDAGPDGGGGDDDDPHGPGPEGLEVDWTRFEREFHAYVERAGAVHA